MNPPANLTTLPRKLSLDEWDARYAQLSHAGLREPGYGGPLRRHQQRHALAVHQRLVQQHGARKNRESGEMSGVRRVIDGNPQLTAHFLCRCGRRHGVPPARRWLSASD